MSPSFSEHLELLEQHGHAAVTGLESLSPKASVPPDDATVLQLATEHWSTLEIWSWSLAHPDEHWSQRADPAPPSDHAALIAGIAAETDRLVAALTAAGPSLSLDYFGRPGTTADVARLLAFQAVTMAHSVSLAAGAPSLALTPATATDGVGQALRHWASADLDAAWRPRPVAIRTTDTGQAWYLSLPEGDDLVGDFRIASPESPAAVVEGPAENVLWWLHGHVQPMVSVTGEDAEMRAVKSAFRQPVEKAPRRWFGLRSP